MKRSRYTETQIISILKEADAGAKVKYLCRRPGISDATYYNWKSKYGGLVFISLAKWLCPYRNVTS